MGEAMHMWGQWVYEKYLYILNFAVNQKTVFKNKLYFF